ncbi:MAG: 4Fe-4S dicluster domain-containing protein, partial [Candidatus Zixiibacteriota bacterium]
GMMLDFDFWDGIISGFYETDIVVRSNQCLKLRYPRSKCQRCLENCPASAISFQQKVVLDEYQCTNCGICTHICPSEVFELKPEVEKNIFTQMKESLKRGTKIYLICKKIDKNSAFSSRDNLIEFPCLGGVDEWLLLWFISRGLREIRLATFECGNCPNKKGLPIINETVKIGKELFQVLDLKECSLGKIETQAKLGREEVPGSFRKEVSLSRRELLTGLKDLPLEFGINVSKTVLNSFFREKKEEEFKWGKNIPARHHRLIKAIQSLATGNLKKKNVSGLPLKKVSINDNCSGCNICSTLCPTHALSRVEKDNSVAISFNLAYCVGCGLCKEACPEKAIGYEDEITLEEIFDDHQRKLQEITLLHCQLCQSRYFSREGEDLCPSCRKRKSLSLPH